MRREGDVELLCSSFSIDLCCRVLRAPYEAIEAMAGADRTSLRADVRIVHRPSNCSADRDLGVHATRRPLIVSAIAARPLYAADAKLKVDGDGGGPSPAT